MSDRNWIWVKHSSWNLRKRGYSFFYHITREDDLERIIEKCMVASKQTKRRRGEGELLAMQGSKDINETLNTTFTEVVILTK